MVLGEIGLNFNLYTFFLCADAKQDFDGNYSVQVYSIQACLPKDPATLWNHEFVQAEDLFKQPSTVDNCLLDNRFQTAFSSLSQISKTLSLMK